MGSGLQVFDLQQRKVFDSDLAMGGVCLRIAFIPPGRTEFTFPKAPRGRTPQVLFVDTNFRTYVYDESLGYPRFTFNPSQSTRTNMAGMYLL